MGLKSLFIKDDTETAEVKPKKITEVKQESDRFPVMESQVEDIFSNKANTAPAPTIPINTNNSLNLGGQVSDVHLNQFIEMYQKGFDGLNQGGYDFYEFFKAIIDSGGIENAQMYTMAMSMGTSMDKTNNKSKLLSQADFYINEITKVFNQYVTTGTNKKDNLVTQKAQENQSLEMELTNLKGQLEAIQNQIKSKESQLSLIDNKYAPLISELDSKLHANEFAKERILQSILKVKNGITNFLK